MKQIENTVQFILVYSVAVKSIVGEIEDVALHTIHPINLHFFFEYRFGNSLMNFLETLRTSSTSANSPHLFSSGDQAT